MQRITFDKTLRDETVQDDISLIAAGVDENKLRDLLYTLCVKGPFSADDLEYIKDKLSAPDEIHGLQSETIEHVERLAEILSEGSKRDESYSTMLHDWCKLSVIPARDAGSQKKNMDPSVSCLDDTNIENLTKVFLKSESNEKKSISSIITKRTLEKFKDAEQIVENIQNVVFTHVRDVNSYQIFKRTSSLLKIFKVYIDLYNDKNQRKHCLTTMI